MKEEGAALLREAATLIRSRAAAVKESSHTDWSDRPWGVTECGGAESCNCIVYQGQYTEPLEAVQDPPIQYVADAETEAHGTWIASMHPAFGLAIADWLMEVAVSDEDDEDGPVDAGIWNRAVSVAEAYLKGTGNA